MMAETAKKENEMAISVGNGMLLVKRPRGAATTHLCVRMDAVDAVLFDLLTPEEVAAGKPARCSAIDLRGGAQHAVECSGDLLLKALGWQT